MYYSSGNYEAFARPKKPEGVDNKSAYIVGSGLAALTAACYLVRDGQMKGEHIHILEKGNLPGGACDGYKFENLGYVMRGGREMDNHFEVMWDLFRSIPSIETEGVSVLDEYYWLNKEDPNYSLCRATVDRGQDAHTDGKFDISDKGAMEIMKLFFTPNEDLQDKKITDFFDDEVLNSNFWLYWRTMFAFENWHSALEMKLYIQRYIHHIGGLPDFTALRFTKYNQYESMILPMVKYLESHNVRFHYGVQVTNVEFDCSDPAHKLAKRLPEVRKNGMMDYLRPDGKSQVTVEYDNGKPVRVDAVVISSQHSPSVSQEQLHADVMEHVINAIIPANLLDENTKYYINPTGRFVVGGPQGDSGLTGRKIIVDTYGGYARHGGGAFSGKDPTKVDRSAAYAARYMAKNIVAAGLADKCEVEIAYAIGVDEPVSVFVDSFGTGIIPDSEIAAAANEVFDLRPASIIKELDLRRPIYRQVAALGHVGRTDIDLPWEHTDKVNALKGAAGIK